MNPLLHTARATEAYPCNTQLREEKSSTKNTDSSTRPSFGKSVKGLRFFASIPRIQQVNGASVVVPRTECCEFLLGLGPCGRDVVSLWYAIGPDFLTITQESYAPYGGPAEFKEFTYLTTEITGRIAATLM